MTRATLGELSATPRRLASLITQASEPGNRPAEPGAWDLTEIAAHLLDDECFDFRLRLERLLSEDAPVFSAFPWATGFDRAGDAIGDIVREFALQRQASLNVLAGLDDDDFGRDAAVPGAPRVTVRELVDEWLAHDREHLAQAARIVGVSTPDAGGGGGGGLDGG